MQSHEFCCECCQTPIAAHADTESTAALSLIEQGWRVNPLELRLGHGIEFQVICPNCRKEE